MKGLHLGRFVLSGCVATAMLAACSESQPPIGAPGALTQGRAIATHAERGGSWMLPDAGRDLLYSAAKNIVDVYAYPGGKLVGTLGAFNGAEGLCVDGAGDVFISSFSDSSLYEYAHGGTKQLAVLRAPYNVIACAVDPKTGTAAAISYSGASVFPYSRKRGYRLARYYAFHPSSALYYGSFCTFDRQGDLFVDGTTYQETGFALSELPKGGAAFLNVTLGQSINGPGAMQWIGQNLTVADRGDSSESAAIIYGFAINGSTGKKTSKAILANSNAFAQFWIQGKRVVGPEAGSTAGIGLWNYPKGGAPSKNIAGAAPYGIVVSSK